MTTRSQQKCLADPVSLLKINWVLLNAILNQMLVKLLAVLQEASDFMGNQSTQYSWQNPLNVGDFPLELLSTKLHLEIASLLEKRRLSL